MKTKRFFWLLLAILLVGSLLLAACGDQAEDTPVAVDDPGITTSILIPEILPVGIMMFGMKSVSCLTAPRIMWRQPGKV
jgi:hypothetical protein